jgi:predicted transposase YdaD
MKEKYINLFTDFGFKKLFGEEDSLKYYRDMKNVIDTAAMEAREEGKQEGIELGKQEGEGTGMVKMFLNMLTMRFPNFDFQAYKDKISNAAEEQLNRYSAKLFTAKTLEEVFADDEKK